MQKKRFAEEQIAFALRQHEGGTSVAEITRKLGVSEQTFYRWKKKYAGLGGTGLRRSSMKFENSHSKWIRLGGKVSSAANRIAFGRELEKVTVSSVTILR